VAELAGDGIGGDEADPSHVIRQSIRVLLNGGDRALAVLFLDSELARTIQTVRRQKQHGVADPSLFAPALSSGQ